MQEFSDVEQKKLIWIVIAFCISVIALLGVITLAIFAFFFPLPYAKFLKGVGLNNLALSVYQDVYENSRDIKDGYAYLMESIYAQYDRHIVVAYEMVQENEEFSTFLAKIDESNVEKYGLSRNLLGSLDEYDYVSGKYVSSLCKLGEYEKAYEFAKNSLQYCVNNYLNEQTEKVYLMFDYVATTTNKDQLEKVDNSVQNLMISYDLLCSSNADLFIVKTEYNVKEYAFALECAVRSVEISKSFDILSNAGVETILTKEQIAQSKDEANSRLASVLKKAVN